jgi:isocitrate dehydrogenase
MDKPKTLKVVTLEGTFPEMLIKNAYQQGRGTGSNIRAAAAAAMRDLLKKPGLRARRITVAKITMSVGTQDVVEEDLTSTTQM